MKPKTLKSSSQAKLEANKEEWQVDCKFCGKPIEKKWQAVGEKIPPGQFIFAHAKCWFEDLNN